MAENNQNDAVRGAYESEEEKLAKEAARKVEKKVENKVKGKVKGAVKGAAKKALKAAGSAILKFVAANPIVWVALLILLVVLIALSKFAVLTEFIETTRKGITKGIAVLLDWDMFDEQKIQFWDEGGGDPDYTYQLYSVAEAEYNGTLSYEDDATDADKESITDMLRTDNGYLAPVDTVNILKWCQEYNHYMYEINFISYKYHEWMVEEKVKRGAYNQNLGTLGFKWEENYPNLINTDNDGLFGTLTTENVKGELEDGERIYSVHWQDLYTLAYFYAIEQEEHWGESDKSAYVPSEGGPYVINDTTEYWVTEEELLEMKKLFDYNFNYYYNAIDDKGMHQTIEYSFEDYLNGNFQKAYRYLHDDDLDPATYEYEYYTDSDPGTVGGEYPRETRFVPDSAPNIIYNSIEQYKYTYVSTNEVPGYSDPIYIDGEYKTPHEGIYCVGKWKITDPRPFVNTMAELCPYYKQEAADRDPNYEYIWSDEMMDFYIYYLELIDLALGTERSSYYEHIKELYREEKIEVSYYGMKLPEDEMDAFIEDLRTNNPGMEIEVDFSHAVDYGEWYEVDTTDPKLQAEAGTIPFPSYGVIYNGSVNGDLADYTDRTGNRENYYTGEIYISMHGSNVVDDWIYLVEGADAPLDSGYSYTDGEIAGMLAYMNKVIKGRGDYDFTKASKDVIAFHRSTGADVAAMLAIIITENTPCVGRPTWNWYNFTPTGDEKAQGFYYQRPSSNCPVCGKGHKDISEGRYWYNPKQKYSQSLSGYNNVEGACLVDLMHKIYHNYWTRSDRKQNTYFRMCFNQYGWDLNGNTYYPQDWDSALEQEAIMEGKGHCYCPWWEDAYADSHNPADLWCNKNAMYRLNILASAGISEVPTDTNTGVLFVGDSRTICCFSQSGESTISGEMHDGVKVYAGWGQGFSFMQGAVEGEKGNFDTLAVWLGCNDAAQGKNFADDYGPYYESLLSQGIQIVIFNVGRTETAYLVPGDEEYKCPNMVSYNQGMAAWASGRNGVTYIDVYAMSSAWELNPNDGIHYQPRPTTNIWNYLKARIK